MNFVLHNLFFFFFFLGAFFLVFLMFNKEIYNNISKKQPLAQHNIDIDSVSLNLCMLVDCDVLLSYFSCISRYPRENVNYGVLKTEMR